MEARLNADTGTWHLLGARGCGADPDDEGVSGSWAQLRDTVERSDATKCGNCNWPR